MSKRKAGLHKEISSIFKGVPLRRDASSPDSGVTEQPRRTFSRLPVLERQQTRQPKAEEEPLQALPEQPQVVPAAKPKSAGLTTLKKTFEQIQKKLLTPKDDSDPKRQKTMIILVPTLSVILIIVLTNVLSSSPPSVAVKPADFGPSAAAAAITDETNINWQLPPVYPTDLRDPMQFGLQATAKAHAGNLIVRGIVYNEESPRAVIGTKIVKPGEKVAGAKVIKINPNSVEFEMNGNRWIQKVQQ